MQSSVMTCSQSSFLNFVAIDFDNVATKLWCNSLVFVATGILLLCSFYCHDRKFLCRNIHSSFNSSLCCNMNFFVAIPLVLLFSSLSRQRIHLLHVLFAATEIIFVAVEILLLLIVNSECYVMT